MKAKYWKLPGLVLTLALAFAPSSAKAENTAAFTCYLIVEENARVPAVTFTYTIAPGTAEPSATPAVNARVGSPTIGSAVFANSEAASSTKAEGDDITLASGEKYAKKTVPIDFSGITFTEAGTYRYVITEVYNVNNKGVTYDTQRGDSGTERKRYLDVHVTSGDSGIGIASFEFHKTTTDSSTGGKTTGFVNSVTSYDLTFGKKVAGNQGSPNKYFQFTVSLGSLQPGSTYEVDVSTGAEASPVKTAVTSYDSMSNPNVIQASDSGSASAVFYLKSGQFIAIKELPKGYTYALSEVKEEYTSADGIAAVAATDTTEAVPAYSDPVQNTSAVEADVRTGFTNTRNGVVPTGILLTVAPFVVGLFLFGALFFYMMAKNKRKD